MGRVERWKADKDRARDELHKLRLEARGEEYWKSNLSDPFGFMRPLPEPHTARERFLSICAVGGVWCFEAELRGMYLEAHHAAHTWTLWSKWPYMGEAENQHTYMLHLWIRPGGTESTRQHTKRGCEAELHDGWQSKWMHRQPRKRQVIFRGKVSACLDEAKKIFISWEAATRLGGNPEPLVYL